MSHLIFVELALVILFVWGFATVRKNGKERTLEYAMIFFYGIILEELDMKIFKTYHYAPEFLLTAWNAPLSIAFLWAVILTGSMAISDRIGLPVAVRPFLDALLAVWIDLALDAIAIRLKYWTWIIPLHEGWFGVPPANLYAWMWVAFCYSAPARLIRKLIKKDKRWYYAYLVLPVISYVGLLCAMSSFGIIANALGLHTQNERLAMFFALFLIFVGTVLIFWKRSKPSSETISAVWTWSRLAIHIYFLAAYFLFRLYAEIPLLGVLAPAVLGAELFFMKNCI